MLNKLKVLAPFALVAMALTSCANGNGDFKPRIDRVKYNEITENLGEESHKALDSIFYGQTELKDDQTRRLKLPEAGKISSNVEYKFDGLIKYGDKEIKELPFSNTKYSIAWNIDKRYIEYNDNGKPSYIVKDDENKFWYAFTSEDGKKQRKLVADDFEDTLRRALKDNGTLFEIELEPVEQIIVPKISAEIGLSGLGYNAVDYVPDTEKAFGIAGLFHDKSGIIYKKYKELKEKAGNNHNFDCTIAKGNEVGTFSGNLKGDYDLKALVNFLMDNIPEELKKYKEFLKEFLATDSVAGNVNFDLFSAWAENFICQQEYILNAKDVKYSNPDTIIGDVLVDINTFGAYFGEEVALKYDVTEEMIAVVLADYPIF